MTVKQLCATLPPVTPQRPAQGAAQGLPAANERGAAGPPSLGDLERGLIAGLLIGEGHFGGDGRYPQVTLRMHVRHEGLFRWLQECFPRTRLYGPYNHGGRHYYQWMARGEALARDVLPVVESVLTDELDDHVAGRIRAMKERYASFFANHAG
jgi:hypothetical protein